MWSNYLKEEDILCDVINTGDSNRVKSFLHNHKQLDITYENGKFFVLAINEHNIDILSFLLRYYEEQLSQFEDRDSVECKLLKYRLKSGLERAVEGENLSSEVSSILSDYLDLHTEEDYDNSDGVAHTISFVDEWQQQDTKLSSTDLDDRKYGHLFNTEWHAQQQEISTLGVIEPVQETVLT